jgi:hypothetical protein
MSEASGTFKKSYKFSEYSKVSFGRYSSVHGRMHSRVSSSATLSSSQMAHYLLQTISGNFHELSSCHTEFITAISQKKLTATISI